MSGAVGREALAGNCLDAVSGCMSWGCLVVCVDGEQAVQVEGAARRPVAVSEVEARLSVQEVWPQCWALVLGRLWQL